MKSTTKRKKSKRLTSKILALILLIAIFLLIGSLLYLNILPILVTLIIGFILLFIYYKLLFWNFSKIKGFRYLGNLISFLLIIIIVFMEMYLFNTLDFLKNITNGNYIIKNYNVLTLKSSNYKDIKDLNKEVIGILDDKALEKVQKRINKKAQVQYLSFENKEELVMGLLNEEVAAIILDDTNLSLIKENYLDEYAQMQVIYEQEIKVNIKKLQTDININQTPFNIFISGGDAYGKINASTRSDVNILLTINPLTEKVLITWIPRDYYVKINNSSLKDKLTHAGLYGIDTSIEAVSNLLDVNINYYVKVNFTSLIKLVDVLEGITVYNDETFTTFDYKTFPKGEITLNGEDALSFVRERKNVIGGDVGRGNNQLKVIKALMDKALSKNIITKYNQILKSLDNSFVTNMDQYTIISFIKKELQKRRNWEVTTNILKGEDARSVTYSIPNQEVYVMKPNEDAVLNAQKKIKEVLS